MADTRLVVPVPRAVLIRMGKVLRDIRRLPILPVLLLSLVVVAGITAPWISPHSATRGNLRERNLPPVWSGPQITLKTVVGEVEVTKGQENASPTLTAGPEVQIARIQPFNPLTMRHQITLEKAREIKEDAALGEELEVVTREGR